MARRRKTQYSKAWASFCGFLLRLMGWTRDGGPVPEKKAIVLGVPHTSFWDFVVAYLFYSSNRTVGHTMIKKELFFWPLGWILRACGCIPVDRTNAGALVKSIIEEMEDSEVFHLAIAPEGTRKPVKHWKAGAFVIAKETGVPVYAGYFDWGTRHVGVGQKLELTGDPKVDLENAQRYYEGLNLTGKHREKYITK